MYYLGSFPYILGRDFSGVVKGIGKKVKKFKIGDRVCGHLDSGCYAQFCIGTEIQLAKIPSGCSFKQAAAIPLVAETVWQMYRKIIPSLDELEKSSKSSQGCLKGKSILVNGCSGGCGTIASLLGSYVFGGHVYGVCSQKNHEYSTSIGVSTCIDYKKQKYEEFIPKQGDKNGKIIGTLDTVGGSSNSCHGSSILDKTGVFVSCGAPSTMEVAKMYLFGGKQNLSRSIWGGPSWHFVFVEQIGKDLEAVLGHFHRLDLFSKMKIREMPLRKIREAHLASESLRTVGKIVLKVGDDEKKEEEEEEEEIEKIDEKKKKEGKENVVE